MIRKLVAGALGAGLVISAAPAFAGEWNFNPRACPDLVDDRYDRREDRRDARFNAGRRDRIEDRFDRRTRMYYRYADGRKIFARI